MAFRQEVHMGIISALQAVYDASFQPFQTDGLEGQYLRHVISGDEYVRKAKSHKSAVLRTVNQSQLGFQCNCTRSFSADERTSEVETIFRQQLIQVIPGHATGNSRVSSANSSGVLVA